jgi:septum formation protein
LSEKDILITADTVVVADDKILGKPKHAEDAVQMLTQLSGQDHFVYTGVCIRTLHTQESFTCMSKVGFRYLALEEINYYVSTYNPIDKAGAYGIQEWIGYVGINHIEGSYFNVMGLPIQQIYIRLDALIH